MAVVDSLPLQAERVPLHTAVPWKACKANVVFPREERLNRQALCLFLWERTGVCIGEGEADALLSTESARDPRGSVPPAGITDLCPGALGTEAIG